MRLTQKRVSRVTERRKHKYTPRADAQNGMKRDGTRQSETRRTLSTLFPTTILTTFGLTYVSSSLYHFGSASNDSRLATSYTRITPCAPR